MFKADNSQQLLIGKSISRTASVNTLDVNNASYLADGEIVVLDENDTVMTAGQTYANTQYIKIVQRSGATALTSQLIQSDRIDGANVIAFSGKDYDADQEQITHVGFNGTSGSFDTTGTDDMVLRITYQEDKTIWSHYSNTRIFRHEPDATLTEQEIADDLAVKISNDAFSADEVTVERKMNVATVAGGDAGITWTLTNGSVTATTSAATALVAGDYMRAIIVGSDAQTVAVYKVASVSGNTVTLDQKYQGTSGTIVAPAYVAAASAPAASFGLTFTGKVQSFTVGKFKYVKVMFKLQLQNFGTSTVTNTQEAGRGNGTGEEIAELEWFSNGFEGAVDRFTESSPAIKADAAVASNYDVIAIEYFANYDTQVVSGAKPARKLLLIALVDGAAQATNILAVLNPWMASVPRAFANISLT